MRIRAWIGGQLLSGAACGASSAVLGNLMAQAGLDPTANALNGILEQLQQLSKQISDLQATSKQSLEEVLGARFESQFNQLRGRRSATCRPTTSAISTQISISRSADQHPASTPRRRTSKP